MPGLAKHSNGLDPQETLRASTKCPDHPTKRKFKTMREAEEQAAHSSKQYRKTVVPYACAGCGLYHVTGKIDGSDVLTSQRSGPVQTAAMQQREKLRLVDALPERKDMSEVVALEKPIVPANRAARMKMMLAYIAERDTVTTRELSELLSVTGTSVRTLMSDTGWTRPLKGQPGACWVRPGVTVTRAEIAEASPAKMPAKSAARAVSTGAATTTSRRSSSWAAWDELPADMTIGQARQMLAALGMSGELRVWRA